MTRNQFVGIVIIAVSVLGLICQQSGQFIWTKPYLKYQIKYVEVIISIYQALTDN